MRCTMLFKDQAEAPLSAQIMRGLGTVIIPARDVWGTDIETFWYAWYAAFCVHTLLSQAVYISGMFEWSRIA